MLDPLSAAVIVKLFSTKSAAAGATARHLAAEKALEESAKAVAGKSHKDKKKR
jgi:hypothetical protein